jgi:hypothetical protein
MYDFYITATELGLGIPVSKTTLLTAKIDHVDEIITLFFQQVNLISESGVEEWRYNEVK